MTLAERCDKLTKTPLFRNTVMGMIAVAALTAGLGTFVDNNSRLADILCLVDLLFIIFFTAEITIRVIVYRGKLISILTNGWLLFDIVIVAGSVVVQLVDTGESFYVLRLVRVLRALRLLSIPSRFRIVIESFLKSIKSAFYVVLLLTIILYAYAVLGVELFGDSRHFSHLGNALVTMIQILTLDDWGNIFADARGQTFISSCTAIGFFMSFIFFGTLIILNLFVAVVTDQMRLLSDESMSTTKQRTNRSQH